MCGGVSWSSGRGAPILQACLYAREQRYALGAGLLFILHDPLGEEGSGPPSAEESGALPWQAQVFSGPLCGPRTRVGRSLSRHRFCKRPWDVRTTPRTSPQLRLHLVSILKGGSALDLNGFKVHAEM